MQALRSGWTAVYHKVTISSARPKLQADKKQLLKLPVSNRGVYVPCSTVESKVQATLQIEQLH